MAVVFLLSGLLIGRLFYVAVWRNSEYLTAAADQHGLVTQIAPTRGKIYLRDNKDGIDKLYPLASNKELVTIYAVPRDIKDPQRLAEVLYEFFKKATIEKEVSELLDKQDKENLIMTANNLAVNPEVLAADPAYSAMREAKKQEVLTARKKEEVNKYLLALTKKNDPYEPLEKRVDMDLAKAFHLAASATWPVSLVPDDLEWTGSHLTSEKLDYKTGDPLQIPGIGYEKDSFRIYPEKNTAAQLIGYVSMEAENKNGDWGRHGRYGLEGFFDQELFGKFGALKTEKGSGGLTIPNDREFKAAQAGDDLILTLDRTIQFLVAEKIKTAVEKYKAESGSVIILEPNTGAVIAMNSYPDFNPNEYFKVDDVKYFNNPAVFDQYEPGSVFKAITMGAALNEGKVNPETTYNDTGQIMISGWPKPISNSDFQTKGAYGTVSMTVVLERSLNTGAVYAMRQIGDKKFAEYLERFGFGEKTGIELEGESTGNISSMKLKKIKEISAATASFGQGISVTPIQMVSAYAAIANGGYLVKPYVVAEIRSVNGNTLVTKSDKSKPVLKNFVAKSLAGMLVQVVENGHSKGAKLPGYWIAGKTGTAQLVDPGKRGYVKDAYNHTFIAFGPIEKPRFVILVRLKNPKGYVYAEETVVPVAKEIMEFMMNYWQVAKTRQ